MNPYLIAVHGISGTPTAIAVQGFSTIDDVVAVPYVAPPPAGSAGGGFGMANTRHYEPSNVAHYYSRNRERYEIAMADDEEEDELIVITLLARIADEL